MYQTVLLKQSCKEADAIPIINSLQALGCEINEFNKSIPSIKFSVSPQVLIEKTSIARIWEDNKACIQQAPDLECASLE